MYTFLILPGPFGGSHVPEIQASGIHVFAGVACHPQERFISVQNEAPFQVPLDHSDDVRLEHPAQAGLAPLQCLQRGFLRGDVTDE